MKVTIIGAGNVGTHLALALHGAGCSIQEIFSRQPAKAGKLAKKVGATPVSELRAISPASELCLMAVKDDAIGAVTEVLSARLAPGTVLAHTSGATPSSVLSRYWPEWGVFYPLQTLSLGQPVDFDQIPMCIDGATTGIQEALQQLAARISRRVHLVDDSQRATLHLAAVFINNFINAMLQAGHNLTKQAQLPPDILGPLLRATVENGTKQEPRSVQTGPAIRHDQQTLNRHLGQLGNHTELSAVYKAITAYIQTF